MVAPDTVISMFLTQGYHSINDEVKVMPCCAPGSSRPGGINGSDGRTAVAFWLDVGFGVRTGKTHDEQNLRPEGAFAAIPAARRREAPRPGRRLAPARSPRRKIGGYSGRPGVIPRRAPRPSGPRRPGRAVRAALRASH